MIRSFHTLPPVEALEGMDALQVFAQEHANALAEWRGCNTEYDRLKTALDDARRADEEGAVAAYREGKAHPGKRREQKVLKQMEEVQERAKVREGALTSIERDIAGAAQKAREKIPKLEAAIETDNQELFSLLEKVRAVQDRRAKRRGLVEWLTELPGSYRPITHTSNGITEDTALGVLVGSTQPPQENPDQGSVTYLAG